MAKAVRNEYLLKKFPGFLTTLHVWEDGNKEDPVTYREGDIALMTQRQFDSYADSGIEFGDDEELSDAKDLVELNAEEAEANRVAEEDAKAERAAKKAAKEAELAARKAAKAKKAVESTAKKRANKKS